MNSKRKSPVLNLLSLLVLGATVLSASMGAWGTEGRDGSAARATAGLEGRSPSGFHELSLHSIVLDKRTKLRGATEASATEVEALAPYLEMHGRAQAGVRPVILPWSVRMESVN